MSDEKDYGESGGEEKSLPAFGLAEDILGKIEKDKAERMDTPAPEEAGDGESRKYVTFSLLNEEYALSIDQVQEINRVVEITRVPNSPAHVLGVINLRGKIVPVIDLRSRLHIGTYEITKNSRVVVVEHGPKVLGLLVDRVAQVLNISAGQIEQAPEEVVQVDENYIEGVGKIDERMIIILNLDKVVGAENTQ